MDLLCRLSFLGVHIGWRRDINSRRTVEESMRLDKKNMKGFVCEIPVMK
jgi:hypothetical protein